MDYYYLIRYFISPSVSLAIWEYKFQAPRHFVSGFPRALLSLSQEKSSGVEIDLLIKPYNFAH